MLYPTISGVVFGILGYSLSQYNMNSQNQKEKRTGQADMSPLSAPSSFMPKVDDFAAPASAGIHSFTSNAVTPILRFFAMNQFCNIMYSTVKIILLSCIKLLWQCTSF